MTDKERELIDLIPHGYTRREIGQRMGLGDTAVKRMVRRLCARYECSMRELPQKAKEKHNGGQGSL